MNSLLLLPLAIYSYRLMFLSDPFTLPLPPTKSWSIRFRALLTSSSSYVKFSFRSRLFLLFRAMVYVTFTPVWIFLWTLDDVLFANYRKVEIVNPVFLVGGEA